MSLSRRGTQRSFSLFFSLILLGLSFPLSAAFGKPKFQALNTQKGESRPSSPGCLLVECGWGWNSPTDSRYKEVYSKGSGIVTFSLHPFFKSMGRHSFGLSAGIKSFSKEGESTVSLEKSRLTLIPISLGGEYMLNLEPFYPGVELGIDHCFYREESPLMTTKGSTTGYHIQGNLVFQPPGLTFLRMKLYIRHSRLPSREAVKVNLGGLEYGAGFLFKLSFPGSKNQRNREKRSPLLPNPRLDRKNRLK